MANTERERRVRPSTAAHRGLVALSGLLLTSLLTGCFVIGGSSRGGFFIWPGGLGLVVIIVVLALLLRRR